MKRFITLNIVSMGLFCFTQKESLAQNSVSIIGGINQSNIVANGINADIFDFDPIHRLHAGVIFERNLNTSLSVRSGMMYMEKGFQWQESTLVDILGVKIPLGARAIAELKSLEIPLSLKYSFDSQGPVSAFINAGMHLNYAHSGSIETRASSLFDFSLTRTDLQLQSSAYNRWGADGTIGGGVEIRDGNRGFYTVQLAYQHALNDFTNENTTIIDAGIRNHALSLSVGYGIRF